MNEDKLFLMLEQINVRLGDITREIKDFKSDTNSRFDSIENRLESVEKEIKDIKEDTTFLRQLSDEAFKDIHMLDKRTVALRLAK